jgi:hypothetical protein
VKQVGDCPHFIRGLLNDSNALLYILTNTVLKFVRSNQPMKIHLHRRKRLSHGVVQLAADPPSLVVLRAQEPRRNRGWTVFVPPRAIHVPTMLES